MKKYLTIAATLVLGLGAASAQATDTTAAPAVAPVAAAAVTNFTDIPAGHWAKDAVALITEKGLIQGFPDGTFRGNENLTRYQAALIFARLLQNGGLSNSGLSDDQVATITKGMQDVSTELAAVSTRVSDLEKASADQQARIEALEGKIDSAATAGNTTDLSARVDALEAAVKAIPAPAAAVDLTDVNNRLAALEARPVATTPVVNVNTTPATPTIISVDNGSATAVTGMGLYAGIDTTFNFSTTDAQKFNFGNSGDRNLPFFSSFGAVVGASNFIYGLGARVDANYTPAFESFNADANLMYTFGTGSTFSPYAGLGVGITNSYGNGRNSDSLAANKVSDFYVHGLLGADYRVVSNVGLFAEFDAKYYTQNKTAANGIFDNTKSNGFVPAAKLGLKYFF